MAACSFNVSDDEEEPEYLSDFELLNEQTSVDPQSNRNSDYVHKEPLQNVFFHDDDDEFDHDEPFPGVYFDREDDGDSNEVVDSLMDNLDGYGDSLAEDSNVSGYQELVYGGSISIDEQDEQFEYEEEDLTLKDNKFMSSDDEEDEEFGCFSPFAGFYYCYDNDDGGDKEEDLTLKDNKFMSTTDDEQDEEFDRTGSVEVDKPLLKRRKISAVRDFPVGCGRHNDRTEYMIPEDDEPLLKKRKISDVCDGTDAVNQVQEKSTEDLDFPVECDQRPRINWGRR
ncbi:hypothetical protein SOVF_134910 [Spinacia oleracea]|nr:hypothetical protein SOVF_134910 [Spinacia oleracea]